MDGMRNQHRLTPGARQKGIGLYTYQQEKNTTPFQYFVQIVVGLVIFVLGGCLLYQTVTLRHEEISKYGSADAHVWEWLVSFGVLTIGVFLCHAGVIFYFGQACRGIHKFVQRIRYVHKYGYRENHR